MRHIIIVILIVFSQFCTAQETQIQASKHHHSIPIPIEVMTGNNWTMYQSILVKDFGKNKKFNFFNLVNYEVAHDKQKPDSYIIQSLFSYKINNFIAVGAGANFKAFGGFKPLLASQITHFNRNIGLVIQPSIELDKEGVSELFALFEWHPSSTKKWTPYASIQGAINLTTKNGVHDFSYANLRLGVQHGIFKFGPALNSRFVGNNFHSEWNVGGFVSISIF